jgi:MFS superfamily sulfate permease-like transporter
VNLPARGRDEWVDATDQEQEEPMLTTLIVATVVVAFTLVAAIGHALLFSAVVLRRATVFLDKGTEGREPAPRGRVQPI